MRYFNYGRVNPVTQNANANANANYTPSMYALSLTQANSQAVRNPPATRRDNNDSAALGTLATSATSTSATL
jgi:hypothetical protein